MYNERIVYLLKKRYENIASDDDIIELQKLIQNASEIELKLSIEQIWNYTQFTHTLDSNISNNILKNILKTNKNLNVKSVKLMSKNWFKYAAVFFIMVASIWSTYYFQSKYISSNSIVLKKYKGDVLPGKNGAKIKLSNGTIILIDSLTDGLIAVENGVQIIKENGKIVYNGTSNQIIYNEIITDKGRQWSTILPDSSIVWLNANSTLKFPLNFSANERAVELVGEAAFRVVHNSLKPFRVKVAGQIVEDIGTEFNISAYSDESYIKTTLIEGSAFVKTSTKKVLLKAGEQSLLNHNSENINVSEGNIVDAIAWRKGLFSFKDADIKSIMRQLARWYDVEIKYEGEVSTISDFSGKMDRNLSLTQILKALSNLRVHFRIEEDKRIVIMP